MSYTGSEMYGLMKDDFKLLEKDGECYLTYSERVSKTNAGGLNHMKYRNKSSEVKEDKSLGERCVVHLYKAYTSKCPSDTSHLWCQPINTPRTPSQWFSRQRLGIHSCQKMMKRIATEGGLGGRLTNHSMLKTTVTRLFDNNVDDCVIKKITGHRSQTGLEAYKTINNTHINQATQILGGKQATVTQPQISEIRPIEIQREKAPIHCHYNLQNCNVTINHHPN